MRPNILGYLYIVRLIRVINIGKVNIFRQSASTLLRRRTKMKARKDREKKTVGIVRLNDRYSQLQFDQVQSLDRNSITVLLDSPRLRRHYREQLSGMCFLGK